MLWVSFSTQTESHKDAKIYVFFANEAFSTAYDTKSIPKDAKYVTTASADPVTCDVSGAKYFAIQWVGTKAAYFDKIEITYKQ